MSSLAAEQHTLAACRKAKEELAALSQRLEAGGATRQTESVMRSISMLFYSYSGEFVTIMNYNIFVVVLNYENLTLKKFDYNCDKINVH